MMLDVAEVTGASGAMAADFASCFGTHAPGSGRSGINRSSAIPIVAVPDARLGGACGRGVGSDPSKLRADNKVR